MKTLTTFCFAVLAWGFCNAQTMVYAPKIIYTSHKLADNDLKGKVKSVDYLGQEYWGNELPKEEELIKGSTYEYNQKGLLTKFSAYASESENPGSLAIESFYKYDGSDNLILVEDVAGDTKSTTSYKYSGDGRLVEYKYVNYDETVPTNTINYNYNSKNRTTTVLMYSDTELSSKSTVVEDAQGRVVKMTSYECFEGKAGSETMSVNYKYDEKGNLVSETSENENSFWVKYYYENNRLVKKEMPAIEAEVTSLTSDIIEYDAQGRVIKISSFSGEDKNPSSVIEYEYDAQGNWIKMLARYNEESGAVSVRKITYY